MQASEKLGMTGVLTLVVVVLEVVTALLAGFTATLYFALPLTFLAFVILLSFCRGSSDA